MALFKRDQYKLQKAGFDLYRLDLKGKRIKIANSPGTWVLYKKFETQEKCLQAFGDLMALDEKAIEV